MTAAIASGGGGKYWSPGGSSHASAPGPEQIAVTVIAEDPPILGLSVLLGPPAGDRRGR